MDIETCHAMLPRALPGVEVRAVEELTRGWDNVVLEVNDEWIVRFARREETALDMRREAALLPVVAPLLAPVAVPEFTNHALDGSPRPGDFVAYRKLYGRPLAGGGAAAVAAVVSRLHQIPIATLPQQWQSGEGWRSRTEGDIARARAATWSLLPSSARTYLDGVFAALLAELEPELSSVLLHADLTPPNVLVDPGSARVVAVIDWGDAKLGDPAYDLGVIGAALGWSFGEQVADHCGAGDALRRRMGLYARLRPLEHLVFALAEGESRLVTHLSKRISAEAGSWS